MGVRTRLIRTIMVVATLITAMCLREQCQLDRTRRTALAHDGRDDIAMVASALRRSFLLFVDNIARRATTGIPLGILTALSALTSYSSSCEGRKGDVMMIGSCSKRSAHTGCFIQLPPPERSVEEFSFSVPRGRVVGILGANGAGKSTLFKLILGVLPLQSGEIKINGRSVKTLSNRERAKQMAYIPQTQRGTFQFTVAEMVLMGTTASFSMFSQPGKRERIKAAEAMKLLQIEQFSDRLFDQLSGGEQQLVLIARAVAQDAPILIMDEPTASLDYGNQIRVLEEIRQLANRGYLVLISTHNPQHIFLYADDVLLIDGGTAIAFGKPQDVLSEALLSHVYRVPIQLEKSVRTEMVTVLPHFEKMRNHDMTDRKTDCKHACERTL